MDSEKTILIVDDAKVNILKAEYILKEYGFHILSADSGKNCIKRLLANKVDLVLLDIEMPEMDGFETLDIMRKDPRTSGIPVIFVTGDKDMDVVLKALQHKVAGYVTKPFDEDELMSHVKRVLFPVIVRTEPSSDTEEPDDTEDDEYSESSKSESSTSEQ